MLRFFDGFTISKLPSMMPRCECVGGDPTEFEAATDDDPAVLFAGEATAVGGNKDDVTPAGFPSVLGAVASFAYRPQVVVALGVVASLDAFFRPITPLPLAPCKPFCAVLPNC
jgi:hypothetical protein